MLTAVVVFAPVTTLQAHDPGLSFLDVRVAADGIGATLLLAPRDAERAARLEANGTLTAEELANATARLEAFAIEAIVLTIDGRPVSGTVDEIVISSDDTAIRLKLAFRAVLASRLAITSRVAAMLGGGHRQLLSVRKADGTSMAERMLGGESDEGAVDLEVSTNRAETARQFLTLGIEHILNGYDHLLFLAGLLIVVARVRDLAKTVTAFTVGHSLTLACAAMGLVRISAGIIEPLIAASIVYVGIENLCRPPVNSRWKIALAFGLLHGFGFAGALQELGLGASGADMALRLAAFNFGVETGQIAVAAAVWPIMLRLATRPSMSTWLTRPCSVLVACAGVYWLVTRLLVSVA